MWKPNSRERHYLDYNYATFSSILRQHHMCPLLRRNPECIQTSSVKKFTERKAKYKYINIFNPMPKSTCNNNSIKINRNISSNICVLYCIYLGLSYLIIEHPAKITTKNDFLTQYFCLVFQYNYQNIL